MIKAKSELALAQLKFQLEICEKGQMASPMYVRLKSLPVQIY